MYGGIRISPILSVLHHLSQTSCTEILAFLQFPPYQHIPDSLHVRRNIGFPGFSPYSTTYSKQVVRRFWLFTHFLRTNTSPTPSTYGGILDFPDSLRTPPPIPNKLYGDFGFSLISSVPAPPWLPPRTEEYLFSRFSPYFTTYTKKARTKVRAFLLNCQSHRIHLSKSSN